MNFSKLDHLIDKVALYLVRRGGTLYPYARIAATFFVVSLFFGFLAAAQILWAYAFRHRMIDPSALIMCMVSGTSAVIVFALGSRGSGPRGRRKVRRDTARPKVRCS